jgi:hypothetical protein
MSTRVDSGEEMCHSLTRSRSPKPPRARAALGRGDRVNKSMPSGINTTASPTSKKLTSPPSSSPQRCLALAGTLICPRWETRTTPEFVMPDHYKVPPPVRLVWR